MGNAPKAVDPIETNPRTEPAAAIGRRHAPNGDDMEHRTNHSSHDAAGTQSCEPASSQIGSTAQKVDIIWNITRVCPYNCPICCVAAFQPKKRGNVIELAMPGQTAVESFPYAKSPLSIFEQALRHRQEQGLELTLEGKLRILDHVEGFAAKIDFSGGDPLIADENTVVMRAAAKRLGRNHVTVTATGPGIARFSPSDLAEIMGELNFTYDGPDYVGGVNRPDGYAQSNLRFARAVAKAGVKTRAELPLTLSNINAETLRRIYCDLHEAGIDKLLVMRLFPVGSGTGRAAAVPSPQEYRDAIGKLRELERELEHPRVKLQCALRFFDQPDIEENPCDLFRESFGLMADGTLLASSWAIGGDGKPLDDAWVLGNLATTPLKDILSTPKAREYAARLGESFGHCRIHAFLNSQKSEPMDRIFDSSDPMYAADGHSSITRPTNLVLIGGLASAPKTVQC